MKNNFHIFALAFVLFYMASFLLSADAKANILISKIQAGGKTSTDEFVELYNPDGLTVNLKNWSLKKQTAAGKQYILASSFPANAKIAPSGYLIIAHKNYTNTFEQYLGVCKNGLNLHL